MVFVDRAHTTTDTDTHADQTEIEGLGFVTGAHTADTKLIQNRHRGNGIR